MKTTPVLLLTGYLGSGKTTLVNRILTNKRGIKFAVIVNDIGEVNIDADLIQKGGVVDQKDDSLMALQNGCICCTPKMDLVGQLRDITNMERFDYIVIEASGICEPAPIAQTICSYPSMGPEFIQHGIAKLDCIVTVVDALRMLDEFDGGNDLLKKNLEEDDIENLLIEQIEFCNMILLNKASEVSPADREKLHQIIRGLQPKAEIIDCDYGDVDLDKIINTNMFDFNSVATSATWISEIEKHHDEDEHEEHHHDHEDDHDHCCCGHHHHDEDDDDHDEHEHHHDGHCCHHHHHHDHDADEVFTSWGVETAKKFSKADIERALTELDTGNYGMILRSKGIVDGGADGWLEFDYVPGEWEVRQRGADVGGKLVVIGSKLDEKAIAGLFGC